MRHALVLSCALLVSGCAAGDRPAALLTKEAAPAALAARPATPAPTPTPTPSATPSPDAATRKAVEKFLKSRPGRASVMVRDLKTGASFGYGRHDRYITASVMKVNILIGLLMRKDRFDWGTAGAMIRHSDNGAADSLYRTAGRGPGLGRVDRKLGLEHTVPFPTVWGATQTCAADQVKLLAVLAGADAGAGEKPALSASQRAKVLRLMETVTPEQRWGVGAAALKGDKVANKNGWTPVRYQGSGWAVHSVGRITGHGHDFLVAVFSAEQPSMGTGVRTVEGLAEIAVGGLR